MSEGAKDTVRTRPPKLRDDLIIRRHEVHGALSFVVKNPDTGEFYRFREAEHFIASQLDGSTTTDVVRLRTEEQFGRALPEESLQSFIKLLKSAHLLDTQEPARASSSSRRRLRGDLFSLRYKLLDPALLLDRMIEPLRFFFTPAFVASAATLIFIAVWTTIECWSAYTRDLPRMFTLTALPVFLIVNFLVVTAHEFAHGLTCRYYGGEVREMGFMLMYFQPALYCNVSDAWLFPERSKRLWVGFAGPFFELALWALATIAWRLTEPDTAINFVSLVIMTTSGIKTLINFNPFIKLDGYYLLSDLLDIPNLRKKSFRYLGDGIKRFSGARVEPVQNVSRREKLIYVFYASIASVASFLLLGFTAVQMGGFFLHSSQPIPLTMLFGFIGLRFRDRVNRLFVRNGSKKPAPRTWNPFTSMAKPSRPRKGSSSQADSPHSIRWYLLWYAAAILGIILLLGKTELRVIGPFVVLPVNHADVRTEIDGMVQDVHVQEGDRVIAGAVVATLSALEYRTDLAKTEAQITQSTARLRMLELGPTKEEMDLARTAVQKARERVRFASSRSERNRILYGKNMMSRLEYETGQEQMSIARSDLSEAEQQLQVLVRGSRPEQLDAARAELAGLQAERARLIKILGRLDVRTPVSGIVATPTRQLRELMHQNVAKGGLIARVHDPRKLTVEIAIPEKEIADVQVGHTVAFKARAFPDETFYGTVIATATTAQPEAATAGAPTISALALAGGSASTSVLVTTVIDNSSLLLKPGMTGQAKISCGDWSIPGLILRRIARTVKVEFWSWW